MCYILMNTTYKLIDQNFHVESKWGSAWVFYLITFIGFIISIVAIPVLLSFIVTGQTDVFGILISMLASAMGLIFFWTGLRSPAKGHAENITFSNSEQKIKIVCNKQKDRTIVLEYSDIHGLHIAKRVSSSGSSNNHHTVFMLFLVLSSGAVFWLASTNKSRKWIDDFLTELRDYCSIALNEITLSDIDFESHRKSRFNQELIAIENPYPVKFASKKYTNNGVQIRLKRSSPGFSGGIIVFLILFIFLTAPLIPFISTFSEPEHISILFVIFGSMFATIWYVIVSIVILFYLRQKIIIPRGNGLFIQLHFMILVFLNRTIEISGNDIAGILIHRLEEGHCVLAIHLKKPMQSTLGWLLSKNPGPVSLTDVFRQNHRNVFPIARAEGWNLPGSGPLIEDLFELKSNLKN